jgi:hypothetical protein
MTVKTLILFMYLITGMNGNDTREEFGTAVAHDKQEAIGVIEMGFKDRNPHHVIIETDVVSVVVGEDIRKSAYIRDDGLIVFDYQD